jgi:hypothetical protein
MNDRSLTLMQTLNSECFCIGLDDAALRRALERELERPELVELVKERCPHLFAARPVFASPAHLQRMAAVVRAVESVVALPAYREEVLARAPAIAQHEPGGARSVFFGYDFHVDGDRLGLIEINTNAGGAMLNAVLARAQRACCPPVESLVPTTATVQALEQGIVTMFRNEWRLSGRTGPLRRIAMRRRRAAAAISLSRIPAVPAAVRAARPRGGDRRSDRTELAWRCAVA